MDFNEKIDSLINEADKYTFETNSNSIGGTVFAKASSEMRAWIAECEDFIKSNYDKESSPVQILKEFKINIFTTSFRKVRFNQHKEIIISALKSCKRVQPNKTNINKGINMRKRFTLNEKIGLTTLLLSIVCGSFFLGKFVGENRFDQKKIDLTQDNQQLKQDTSELRAILFTANETINNLKEEINNPPPNESKISPVLELNISYYKPKSIFDGSVLITAEDSYRKKLEFKGIKGLSKELIGDYKMTTIEIDIGDRFFMKLENNEIWIVNVISIISGIDIELLKK